MLHAQVWATIEEVSISSEKCCVKALDCFSEKRVFLAQLLEYFPSFDLNLMQFLHPSITGISHNCNHSSVNNNAGKTSLFALLVAL